MKHWLKDPWHSQGIPGPYPDRFCQILVKMPRTNPDKMGPKCLGSQIDDPDRNARKYYSLCLNPDKYQHGPKNSIIMDLTPGPVITEVFQRKQYLLIPSIQFLCLLDTRFSSNQALPYIDMTSDMDMERFKALKKGKNGLISALKLSRKRGGV